MGGLGLALEEPHKPSAESFLGVAPLSSGFLASSPPIAFESCKSVSHLLRCESGVTLCSVSAKRQCFFLALVLGLTLMAQSGLTPDEPYSPGSRVAVTPMIYVAVL